MNGFQEMVRRATGMAELQARSLRVLQVNVGLRCNLACTHCHVSASPRRREEMAWATMVQVVDLAGSLACAQVDLTGGAPELHPHLPRLITALRRADKRVQLRTNLVVLLEPGLEELAVFLRDQQVQLVASLPCYLENNVDAQRGKGTYDRAILAMRLLNQLGYGVAPELALDLVYNPGGASLPMAQCALEADYRRELHLRHGIVFTRLLTIANMPIGRFGEQLRQTGGDGAYHALLGRSFNPATLDNLMCRHQIAVRWDGLFFDCDFNLALGLQARIPGGNRLSGLEPEGLRQRRIVLGEHCFGCTAGAGSSCGGALLE